MIRRIIHINEEKCNGCGACVHACHEGAIELINGKAVLTSDSYCDGLGDCLPSCPTGAITFEEREAAAYDEAAVEKNKRAKEKLPCGCAGTHVHKIDRKSDCCHTEEQHHIESRLSQWPVQIKLVPVNAPYFEGADLLVAADCTAYAYGNFHNEMIKNRITIIGCPKLDDEDYSKKLTEIIKNNDIKSVTVVRMEVPCCGGIENAVKTALMASGKFLPWQVITVSANGKLL